MTASPATLRTDRWAVTAAAAVTTTGALHLVAALAHLGHDVRFAAFFLGVGAVQACVGPGLYRGARPGRALAVLGATVVLLVAYLHSRTVGLQIGPHADRPEDPDAIGLAVVVCELVTVAAVAALLPPRLRARAVDAVFVAGLGVWGLWLSGTFT